MRKSLKEIEKDILGEAYISNETQRNLLNLCSFGSRFAGTPSEKQAIEYLLGKRWSTTSTTPIRRKSNTSDGNEVQPH
jgi:hypothetical protein